MSLSAYGDYEQLVGGVETLFKDSGDLVMEYANNAYKTAGLSANEYMETVTSFSASLLQSLGGDTQKAAQTADLAITDMSDNANKMGTAMESIQNAYQGFAKQNFTMLDNLKLGYGGTKEEMQRLLEDAEKLSGIEYDISSYADIVEAIHVVQTEMGITGTTAKEASATIQGSVASAKSAWQNLVTGIADGNADLDTLIGNFVDSVGTAADNILPRFTQILTGLGEAVQKLAPIFSEQIPVLISAILPSMVSAGGQLLVGIITGIIAALPELAAAVPPIVEQIGLSLAENWPAIQTAGSELIDMLVTGISTQLPVLIPAAAEAVLKLVETLTNPDSLSNFVDAALQLIISLADGLINALPTLLEKVPVIMENFLTAVVNNFPKIFQTGVDLILKLGGGILSAIPNLVSNVPLVIGALVNSFVALNGTIFEAGRNILIKIGDGFMSLVSNAASWGSDMVHGFINGILSAMNSLLDTVRGLADKIRGFLHFSRPDTGPLRDYETWMPDFMKGLAQGIDANAWRVEDAVSDLAGKMQMNMDAAFSPSVSIASAQTDAAPRQMAETPMGGIHITINGARYSDEKILVQAVAQELQFMLERNKAAYGKA